MRAYIRNMTASEEMSTDEPYTLTRVRSAWDVPPASFCVWVEVANPGEEDLGVRVQIWRGNQMIHETGEELALPQLPVPQFRFEFGVVAALERKTYQVYALINGVVARKLILDFGASRS